MLFLEVDDVEAYFSKLAMLQLPEKYPNVKIVPIKFFDWGKVGFIHDPSGILWHIGEFF